ncbi:MAG: ABC transporter permease [Bacteroidales bacterium]|nr:ABC transporter permease [Bacteroidales bacterium]
MNLRTIGIIISREYQNRVRKKSFLVTTFLVPVLMAALILVPMLLMLNSKEKTKTIAVLDNSGIVAGKLLDTETINYEPAPAIPLDSIKHNLENLGFDAVLNISELTADNTVTADITSVKPLGVEMAQNINSRIEDAVEDYRVESYRIEGLSQIMKDVKVDIRLNAFTIDESGKENISETGVYAVLSMLMGIIIFMFITLFGGMVMSAVIEEKTSRVVEVLVSSVKATELMFGKILGIALVALTQFFLWILLTGAIVGVAGSAMGSDLFNPDTAARMAQTMGTEAALEGGAQAQDSAQIGGDELSTVMVTLRNMDLGGILLDFIIFFVLGYLLYASLFAAVGSAVENEGDSNQLQLPLTIPLMIGYFIAIYAFKAPDSSLAFWGSIIPFTSPIVMLARVPFGVPGWELALSIGLLALTFVLCAWMSAKIYKVGILMFGKKSGFKDLWKWLRQS